MPEAQQFPNWFTHYAVRYFERHLSPLAGQPGLRFLQIGAFTGDASLWLLENVLTGAGSELVDVDTWKGSDEPEHAALDFAAVEATYDKALARFQPKSLVKVKSASADFFATNTTPPGYDFIYIDGDHTPHGVLNDGVAAYRLLKPGGILAFDDYQWKSPTTGEGPGVAIDAMEACHAGRLAPIGAGLQVWFRKLR